MPNQGNDNQTRRPAPPVKATGAGKPKETEVPKSNDVVKNIISQIEATDSILVALSKNPSVDEMTAAIALTMMLDRGGKHATAIYSGKTPNALEFLEPEKTFESNTNSLQDFIIALNKDKADHLRYKLEGDYVKVYITPYRTVLDEGDLEFSHGDYNVDLVIALDVPTAEDLDAALTEYGRIMHDATAINITTGVPGKFAELEWSSPAESSVSEMVADLLLMMKDQLGEIDKEIATALLTGIVAATDRFSNEKTTPKTMALASKLMSLGADQQLVSENMLKINEPEVEEVPEPAGDGSLMIDHAEEGTAATIAPVISQVAETPLSAEPAMPVDPVAPTESVMTTEPVVPIEPVVPVVEEQPAATGEVIAPAGAVLGAVVAPGTAPADMIPAAESAQEVANELTPEQQLEQVVQPKPLEELPMMKELQEVAQEIAADAAAPYGKDVAPVEDKEKREVVALEEPSEPLAPVSLGDGENSNESELEVGMPGSGGMTVIEPLSGAKTEAELVGLGGPTKDYAKMMEEALAESIPGQQQAPLINQSQAETQPQVTTQLQNEAQPQIQSQAAPVASQNPAALNAPVAPMIPELNHIPTIDYTQPNPAVAEQPPQSPLPMPSPELTPPPAPAVDFNAPLPPEMMPAPQSVGQTSAVQQVQPAQVVQQAQSVQPGQATSQVEPVMPAPVEPVMPVPTATPTPATTPIQNVASAAPAVVPTANSAEATSQPVDPGAFQIPGMPH